jgi:ketosteroid isomerase-like protein
MSTDDDKAAVLAVLNAENAAFMRRDLDAWAEHWVHSPHSRFMSSHAFRGSRVLEGWDAIRAFIELGVREIAESYDETRVHLERMNVVVNGDTAWATYDQVGEGTGDNFYLVGTYHQLQIFQRIDAQWKIACIAVMHRATDHEICPLIEVAPDKRVLWMNGAAHEQMANHPALIITGGRLRARNRSHEARLQEVVDWANQLSQRASPPTPAGRLARAVVLGEDDNAVPVICWALVEDGKILVSFNDDQMVKRRVAVAQGVYGLSTAQTQVAHLLAQGHDLSLAAEKLGVTVNTGAHSQSALVGLLLSAEVPTSR